jgi:hypothetical protein
MTTILTENSRADVTTVGSDGLWLKRDDVAAATGWVLKPEGFCKGDICVPIPAGCENEFVTDDAVNVGAFWALMDKPAVSTEAGDAWFLGEGAADRNAALTSLEAPNFTLKGLDGVEHSLVDFRGKRVLLATWASW